LQQTQNLIFLCKSTGSDGTIQGQGVKPPPEVPPERLGFANIQNDDGKFLRRHLLMQAPDETYCNSMDAFSLVLARAYLKSQGKPFTSPLDDQGEINRSLQFGNTPVPQLVGDGSGYRDRDGQLDGYQTLLNFRAVDGKLDRFAPMVSLKDVLENKVPPKMIHDRIVMVGITADTSTKADYWKTPYGEVPGVILQSQMVSQLVGATLDSRSLIRWMPFWAETMWIFGGSLVGGLLVWQLYRVKHQAIACGIALIALSGTCYVFLSTTSLWIPLVPAGMVLVTTGAIVGAFTYRLRHP
jgi:CHASE2 domain-containing sensor protein